MLDWFLYWNVVDEGFVYAWIEFDSVWTIITILFGTGKMGKVSVFGRLWTVLPVNSKMLDWFWYWNVVDEDFVYNWIELDPVLTWISIRFGAVKMSKVSVFERLWTVLLVDLEIIDWFIYWIVIDKVFVYTRVEFDSVWMITSLLFSNCENVKCLVHSIPMIITIKSLVWKLNRNCYHTLELGNLIPFISYSFVVDDSVATVQVKRLTMGLDALQL